MLTVPRNYAAAKSQASIKSDQMQPQGGKKKKVAIVGSGCAGLAAAWALKGTEYEVHLFEKEVRHPKFQ